MATVELRDIRKTFGTVDVIKGVDLRVEDREFVVFVGPSGCGKSTLLRMIAGLEGISSGDLLIDGQKSNDVSPDARGLAMVFQSYALYPHMTVADNMAFSLRLAGVSKEQRMEKVRSAARILQLEPLLERKPKELSGGQRQRVAIGRAIVRQPRVFLFDEPLSNLDAALRVQMRLELARLHQQLDATMIYVTHDQIEAMTMADKIVVLRAGVIEQVGSPLELYHHPANLFVAGFIGSPKMNFLETTVVEVNEQGAAVSLPGGGTLTVPVVPGSVRPGSDVTLGVRPEHLSLGSDGVMHGQVSVVEHLGGGTLVYVQTQGDDIIVVQADGDTDISVYDAVAVGIRPADCHLFDQNGAAIARSTRHHLADRRRGAPAPAPRAVGGHH